MRYLDIHFLNVGHGDCTIVDFSDRLTVIDINACKTIAKESEDELKRRYKTPTPLPFPLQLQPPPQYDALRSILSGLSGVAQATNPLTGALNRLAEEYRKLKEAKDRLTNPIEYLKKWF